MARLELRSSASNSSNSPSRSPGSSPTAINGHQRPLVESLNRCCPQPLACAAVDFCDVGRVLHPGSQWLPMISDVSMWFHYESCCSILFQGGHRDWFTNVTQPPSVRPLEKMTELPAQRNCNLHRPELWLNCCKHLKHWVRLRVWIWNWAASSHCNCQTAWMKLIHPASNQASCIGGKDLLSRLGGCAETSKTAMPSTLGGMNPYSGSVCHCLFVRSFLEGMQWRLDENTFSSTDLNKNIILLFSNLRVFPETNRMEM